MPRPVTPFVGCDVFVVNDAHEVLLIKRTDNGMWALPGGAQDLGESPLDAAIREAREESGYQVRVTAFLGVFSSARYEYVNYPWKENEFTHLLFHAEISGGAASCSEESSEVGWFSRDALPPLSDGHLPRIEYAFRWLHADEKPPAHFE
jgi:ADP-ribose pyrophosphatase YjhB (NUDIX family)